MSIYTYLYRLPSGFIYLFAIAAIIYAIVSPYMTFAFYIFKYEYYVDKICTLDKCVLKHCNAAKCEKNYDIWKQNGDILLALYIIFIFIVTICFILHMMNIRTLYNWFGILLIILSIAIIINIFIIINTSYIIIYDRKFTKFEITNACIIMLIISFLLILNQLFSNDMIHSNIIKLIKLAKKNKYQPLYNR